MEHYKITLKIGDYSLEISSHDKDWLEKKIKEYDSLFGLIKQVSEIQPTKNKAFISPKSSPSLENISVNEYYKNNIAGKIKSRPEIATLFVYYLSKSAGKKEFSTGEIKDQFREVGYPGWNTINIADTLNQAKRRALLNNFNNQWSLSITGEDFVLNKLSDEE